MSEAAPEDDKEHVPSLPELWSAAFFPPSQEQETDTQPEGLTPPPESDGRQ